MISKERKSLCNYNLIVFFYYISLRSYSKDCFFISKTCSMDQVWARLHLSIQLPHPFVFYRFYSAILIFREHHRYREKRIYRYIDRSICAWISYRQKLITFRKYTVRFSWIAFVSIGLSTYRNLDYPVYIVVSLFFPLFPSVTLFLFLVFHVSEEWG